MKKVLLVLVLVLCMAGAAWADTMTDTTLFTTTGTVASEDLVSINTAWGPSVNYLAGTGDWVSWKHQFTYNPPYTTVTSGTLTVYLRDDAGEGDGGLLGYKNEYAFGYSESGNWNFGEVNTGSSSYAVNAAFLADGVFNVTLTSVYGDFYIDKSELTMTVPEPATMLLLGLGLLGVAGIRRKFKSSKS
jgi:hypothetical protein